YAISFTDHEAHAAQRVRDAAYFVVDDARALARGDQLGLVDVAGLAAFRRQQPDAAGLIDLAAPEAQHSLGVGRDVGADQHHVDRLVRRSERATDPIQDALLQPGIDR